MRPSPWILLLPLAFLGCSEDEEPTSSQAAKGGAGGASGSSGASGGGTGGSSTGGRGMGGNAGTTAGTSGTSGTSGMSGMSGSTSGGTGGTGVDLEPCPPGTVCECDDGMDNDGDGLVDWHFDLGCTARNDSTEGGLNTGDLEGGWTIFEPADDTRIIYLSAEGNDSSDGLTPETAKRSLTAGYSALRPGSADWLLLRRGDSFQGFGSNISGRSRTEPIVISSYGTEIEPPLVDAQETNYSGNGNIAIVHLHFRDMMIFLSGTPENVLVEASWFERSGFDSSEGSSDIRTNIALRRNVFSDKGTPIYAGNVAGFLVEENVVYDPATTRDAGHGMYITSEGNSDHVVRGNIVHYGSHGDGIKQRPGGVTEGNVIAGVESSSIHYDVSNPTTLSAIAHGNLILERASPDAGGITFYSGWRGEMTDNIVADEPANIDARPFSAPSTVTPQTGNVQRLEPGDSSRPEVTILGLYSADRLGGAATTTAFFEAAVQQRKYNFRPELTAASIIAFVRDLD